MLARTSVAGVAKLEGMALCGLSHLTLDADDAATGCVDDATCGWWLLMLLVMLMVVMVTDDGDDDCNHDGAIVTVIVIVGCESCLQEHQSRGRDKKN